MLKTSLKIRVVMYRLYAILDKKGKHFIHRQYIHLSLTSLVTRKKGRKDQFWSHRLQLYDDHTQHYSQPRSKLGLFKAWKRLYEDIHQTPEGFIFLYYYLFIFCKQCANHCLKYIGVYTIISFNLERNSFFHSQFTTPKLVQSVHKIQEKFICHHCLSIKVPNAGKMLRSAEIPLHMGYSLATLLIIRPTSQNASRTSLASTHSQTILKSMFSSLSNCTASSLSTEKETSYFASIFL